MSGFLDLKEKQFDKTNAILAGLVFLGAFIVYALTVQRSVPFWDCGEFIACSVILGVPHPPGTPLMVLIGRLFSLLPIFSDVSHRINFTSVVASSCTAALAYLLTVKIVSYFFDGDNRSPLSRFISYAGGVAGGFFTAFGQTNWDNSVEAEVYAVSMAIAIGLVYITIRYFETKGTFTSTRLVVLYFYLAVLGIGFALMGFLVVPVCAIAFILKKDAEPRDWVILCSCLILELIFIIMFSNGRGGVGAFYLATAAVLLGLLWKLYNKVNWIMVFAIACVCSTIIAFDYFLLVVPIAFAILLFVGLAHVGWSNTYRYGALVPIALACSTTAGFKWGATGYILSVVILLLGGAAAIASTAQEKKLRIHWRSAAAVLAIAIVGFSVHLYLPVRSTQQPSINENNPSRDYRTFVNFLDRKQYGSESMVDRMFKRRATWENQFGWHPNMGFWSYFEGQWSKEGVSFIPWFLLGVIGIGMAIKRRVEVGMPFLTIFLLCSVGLILYMNFADGTKYDWQSGDAYLEVRDRDYFFTSAFVFFSIAMGAGVSAVLQIIRKWLGKTNEGLAAKLVYALGIGFVCLPTVALATNFHVNDRSNNRLAFQYAKALLDSCDPNTIIFTSGDNDTFPVWALQEAYGYRTDVRVVNLSLLNTDWYVYQMKQQHNIPISLTKEQILWDPVQIGDQEVMRPAEMFNDRPRRRQAYMVPSMDQGHVVKVQDMLVDDIVLENRWKDPIFFSSPPYAESPLKLRNHATAVGMVYRLDRDSMGIDLDKSFDLYMNKYDFTGMEDCKIYRDENATGIYVGEGYPSMRIWDEYVRRGQPEKAVALANHFVKVYPEYWYSYSWLSDYYERQNDSAKALALWQQITDTLTNFVKSNESNLMWREDLGLSKVELGRRKHDQALVDAGIKDLKEAFMDNQNSSFGFRKYASVLIAEKRYGDLTDAAKKFIEYKINYGDPLAQQILNIRGVPSGMGEEQ